MRLIDADELAKKFTNANASGINLALDRYAVKCIEDAPTIEQPERKHGKWIEANTHIYGIYECTVCKAWTYIPNEPRDYNFCPRCGTDMRRNDDESN